jgi:signal transduction histidine kinase
MLSRLETSMSAMTDISANIAHELKTPISRLRHDLNTALDQTEQGKDAGIALNDAYEESSHITETFDALLRIAQIEGGARRANFATLDLNTVIGNVMDIYVEVAEDAGMSLVFAENLQGKLEHDQTEVRQATMIQGDKELLVQMLANLIENSIRYCPEGTAISIACLTNGEQVKLSVSDNGPGIPLEDRENVFQRLYRGDKSRTDKRGTGLGLSLVKAIVELHGAEIELVDNEPGVRVEMKF